MYTLYRCILYRQACSSDFEQIVFDRFALKRCSPQSLNLNAPSFMTRWCRTAAANDCSQTVVTVNEPVHDKVTNVKQAPLWIHEQKYAIF